MRRIYDEVVALTDKFRLHGPLVLKIIEVFEEQHPGGLLGIVQLRRATGLFPENVIYVFESLFEHLALALSPDLRA